MSDAFTIVLFSAVMFLFLVLAYGTGALDAYSKGYSVYVDAFEKQILASEGRSEEIDPDELLHRSMERPDDQKVQILYGCQGLKQRRRHSAYGTD
ncbi:MAG: hypothetical protein ACFFED_16450 [Candidatus Thorarchaeota archaeon]